MGRIMTEKQYEAAVARLEVLMDAAEGTPEAEELEALGSAIEAYEDVHYRIAPPPAAAAIAFRMDQAGLSQADVSRITGISRPKLSEILSGAREPSKAQIRELNDRLGVPLEHLLAVEVGEGDARLDFVNAVAAWAPNADAEPACDWEADLEEHFKDAIDDRLVCSA